MSETAAKQQTWTKQHPFQEEELLYLLLSKGREHQEQLKIDSRVLVWGFFVLHIAQFELFFSYSVFMANYVDPHPGPRSTGFMGRARRAPITEIFVIQINNAGSATDTAGQTHSTFPSRWLSLSSNPPSTPSSCNELVLIKVQSNRLMVLVSVDCCINMFFKNWNYYLLFSDVKYIFDRGRGCLFSMQRGSIMTCICRTVWQNIKQGKRDVCMNLSPLSPNAQQPQGRRLESSGSPLRRDRD